MGIEKENSTGKALRTTGILFIFIGIIGGFILGASFSEMQFNWTVFLLSAVGGSVSGILFLGLSEVIGLLADIQTNFRKQQDFMKTLVETEKEKEN